MNRSHFLLSVLVTQLACASAGCRNKNSTEQDAESPPDASSVQAEAEAAPAPHNKEKPAEKKSAPTKPEAKMIPAPDDVAAPPATAQKSASGLAWTVLTPGTGSDKPEATDKVTVHYSGWDKSGKMFDSSVARGEPTSFPLNGVIKGWTEGLQLMTVGEKRRFWIPADLAYGEKPRRPGAPSGQLTFDVELLEIKHPPKPPEVPADVAAAPADATKTASGLAYKILKQGEGKLPGPTSPVLVHYSGWTKDGKMFDSSVLRDRPQPLRLNQVIPGWTEGLQLMKAGSKFRFWIPPNLAYGEKPQHPGAPTGQLTFDVELIEVM